MERGPELRPHREPIDRRQRWRRVRATIQSRLRRYPRELLHALLERQTTASAGVDTLDHIARHPFAVAWLGHGSVLARLGTTNILVDPVFSDRIGVRLGRKIFGVKRLGHAPITPEGLPVIDLVLVTHAHFDHLDKPSLRRLARSGTTVVTAPGTRRLIPRGFGAVIELPVGRTLTIHGTQIQALRPNHSGARSLIDRHRQFNSYVLTAAAGRMLFVGDTAYTDAFRDIGRVDVAAFGIGAYAPREHAHATPEQVWRMCMQARIRRLLPVHHSTFELSDEPLGEPMRRLLAAAGDQAARIIQTAPGELWFASDDVLRTEVEDERS